MTVVTLDITKFREMFPAFSSEAKFPDSLITMYWSQVICMMDDESCGCPGTVDCTELNLYLLLAHLLAMHANVMKGKQGGFVQSSSVDKVSVSKVAPPVADMFDWWLSQTPYGQQLVAMIAACMVGGFSVGGLPERKAFRKVGGTFQ